MTKDPCLAATTLAGAAAARSTRNATAPSTSASSACGRRAGRFCPVRSTRRPPISKASNAPADLNYEGYPKSVCTSINDVVCHGIPCDADVLHEGDIINVDCSTILDGYFSDSSRMFCIGEVSAERQRLVDVTRASVEAGLAAVKPWLPLSVMAEAVQKTVEDAGFSVVREYGGHGIGKEFHEDPFVGFTTEAPDVDTIMAPGMVFTIEPMVNAGAPDIKISKGDGWCVRTKDGSDSAQCEVQLVVTEDGYELLSW